MLELLKSLPIGQLTTFAAIGGFIDIFVNEEHKKRISGYIFRLSKVNAQESESAVVTGLIQIFCKKNNLEKLSLWKIFVFSSCVSSLFLILYIVLQVLNIDRDGEIDLLFGALIIFILLSTTSFSFDLFSIFITKKFFYYKYHSTFRFISLAFIDLFLSVTPPVVFIVVSQAFVGDHIESSLGKPYLMVFAVLPFVVSLLGVALINIIQLTAWVMGNFIRLIWTPLLSKLFNLEGLRKLPFTSMMFLTGVVITVIDAVA